MDHRKANKEEVKDMSRKAKQYVTCKGTHNIPDYKKRAERDPKIYTGELFLETLPKLNGAFKQ